MSLHFSKTPNKEKLRRRGLYRQEETFMCARTPSTQKGSSVSSLAYGERTTRLNLEASLKVQSSSLLDALTVATFPKH